MAKKPPEPNQSDGGGTPSGTIDHVTIDLKPAKPAVEAAEREPVKAAAR